MLTLDELESRWLARIEGLTFEGPFRQAHFVHEDGGFFNGNVYFERAGAACATTILEDADRA